MNKRRIVVVSWKRLFTSITVFAVLAAAVTGFCIYRASAHQDGPIKSAVSISYSAVKG